VDQIAKDPASSLTLRIAAVQFTLFPHATELIDFVLDEAKSTHPQYFAEILAAWLMYSMTPNRGVG